MAVLKDEVKHFIVQALACYDTPSQVAEAVKQEFGMEITRQQCALYDPEKYVARNLSAKWKALFTATRKKFIDEVSRIPIANRAYRVRGLGRMAMRAENAKNLALAAQLYEQAAKEVGDIYVNRRVEPDKSLDDEIKRLEIERRRRDLADPNTEKPEPRVVQIGVVDASDPDAE